MNKVDQAVKPYWSMRDEMSVEDGIVLLGSRVIVPESLRGNILQQALWHRNMQAARKVMCLLAKHVQRNRNPHKFVQRLPEIPKLPAEGTYDTFRNPFKTVANRDRRSVSHSTVVVPHCC